MQPYRPRKEGNSRGLPVLQDEQTEVVAAGLTWRLWLPIIFVLLLLIVILVLQSFVFDASVVDTTNTELKHLIKDVCGSRKQQHHSSESSEEQRDHRPDCEEDWKQYVSLRFDSFFAHAKGHSSSKTAVWRRECDSELKHMFDERMNYAEQLLGGGELRPDSWPGNDLWDVKDLKEFMSDKLARLSDQLTLISVQNKVSNNLDNDVDIVIQNVNDIDVDIKQSVENAVVQIVAVVQAVVSSLDSMESYLGMRLEQQSPDSQLSDLRTFIADGFQRVEDIMLSASELPQEENSPPPPASHRRPRKKPQPVE